MRRKLRACGPAEREACPSSKPSPPEVFESTSCFLSPLAPDQISYVLSCVYICLHICPGFDRQPSFSFPTKPKNLRARNPSDPFSTRETSSICIIEGPAYMAGNAPVACLLDLPDETLASIARAVAPLGGRKAQNLRLVNRRLSTIATPIFFASIAIPDQTSPEYDELFGSLFANRRGIKVAATSLAYRLSPDGKDFTPAAGLGFLANLQRLSLSAVHKQELPTIIGEALVQLPQLHTLSLANLHISRKAYPIGTLLGRCRSQVEHLVLNRTAGDGVFGHREKDDTTVYLPHVAPQVLEVYNPQVAKGRLETRYIVFALFACCESARHIVLEWKEAKANVSDNLLLGRVLSDNAKTLRIQGLKPLFDRHTYPAAHLATSEYMAKFLDWVGKSHLPQLYLPVSTSFEFDPAIFNFRMPNLKYLGLSTCGSAAYEEKPDLLNHETFPSVLAFLKASSFPSLHTLHLIGWLDASGIATLATTSPKDLFATNLYLFGLLGFLRLKKINTLILENSDGHPDGQEKCVFEKVGKSDEWSVRLARYW
ncbi:hypothetical protein P7C70_g4912, partial [Phenoliferia sp. Uapishka_3]